MSTLQQGQNVKVSYKVQSGLGVPSSGSGGTGVRFNQGSAGFDFNQASIANMESRSDGQSSKPRLGSYDVPGSYVENLCPGGQDDRIEALSRSTFTAAATVNATVFTSITIPSTTTIAALAGSFLTQGFYVGKVFKLASTHTAGNSGFWLRVVAVTASLLTVGANKDGTAPLTVDATADTAAVFTIAKNVINPTTPTERYFTFDEYDQDLDLSTLISDAKVSKLDLKIAKDADIEVTFSYVGLGLVGQTTGTSPVLTAPTYGTQLPLVASDIILRVNGVDYQGIVTDLTLTYDTKGAAAKALAKKGVDVSLDNAVISGSFTAFKQDLAFLAAATAETQVDIFIMCAENMTNPADFCAFYFGNCTIQKASGPMGSTGERTVTVPFFAGQDVLGATNGHEVTMMRFSTSV